MLMQVINSNMQTIRKEIIDVKKIKEDVRLHVKNIMTEEVKEYMNTLPSLEKRFEELAKEQRSVLSQHIRKSTIQKVGNLQIETDSLINMIKQQISDTDKTTNTDKTADIELLKKQQIDFMTKIEQLVIEMKSKLDKLV